MVISDVARFDEIANAIGNKYLAVKLISKMSRKLGQENKDSRISESKLITWVLTGECPYTDSQLEMRRIVTDNDGLEEALCWIQDIEVAEKVRELYKQSVKQRHLKCCEDNNLSSCRKDRVNILLRMIWYTCTE